jgi:hypothetical protein
MVMKRTSLLLLLLSSLSIAAAGCNKPSDSACRQAITNMRSLMGTDSATANFDTEGDIRRCKGGSTKKAVECAGKATTLDELRACDFMKIPAKSGSAATDPGSAGSAGSAGAPGSAGAGSAGAGSAAAGSADPGSAGSAAGSAGPGSAGSAAGSGSAAAAGSAATMGAGSADAPAAAGSGSAK